ncbi:VOC family protein [Granulicella sp. L60]|uniref:VOC family protein n=1 Tax=Granulicella sp. L60 TaxID=1641866 RepID=UPI00131C3D77|nr:VOC family protein [Granulicella sp. L60]
MTDAVPSGQSPITDAIDHLVIDAGEQIDLAESTYRRLGFHLTPRGRHSIGSVNHLAVFDGPYLELLGFEPGSPSARSDVKGFPAGLNGLVFQPLHPNEIYHQLLERGVDALLPSDLSRPVATESGERTAAFQVVRLAPGSSGFGRLYFCHHLTPELVWVPDRPSHANGATRISRVRVIAEDIDTTQHPLQEIAAEHLVQDSEAATMVYQVGGCKIEMMDDARVPAYLVPILPHAAGRSAYMAVLTFRVADLGSAEAHLKANGIATIATADRVLVSAHEALNVGIEFEAGS